VTLTACLSWFDEDPALLYGCVSSLPAAGVTALVAVDGRYAHFPATHACSTPEQTRAIEDAAHAAGLACHVHRPAKLWADEMTKRTAVFRYAEALTNPDWLLVIDADERIINTPENLPALLAATDFDVATVPLLEEPATAWYAAGEDGHEIIMGARYVKYRRSLFRAGLGLHVTGRHDWYVTADGRRLWGDEPLEPALRVRELVLDHRPRDRAPGRCDAQKAYYDARDAAGVERALASR
jgi:hypothetical protein